jgi:Porin subfamily
MKSFGKVGLGVTLGTLTAVGALLGGSQSASAQAPPGFLTLPGTNINLLITGQVGTRMVYDSAQTGFPGYYEEEADALVPIFIGVGPQTMANGAGVSSFHLTSTDANIGFITSTQTAWGELGTVLILAASFNGDTAYAAPGLPNFSTGITPLLAFGNLGGLMAGVNTSLFGDDDANPTGDMMNEPLAVAGIVGEIIPSIRYTWTGSNGFSIAGAVENAVSEGIVTYPGSSSNPSSGTGFGNFDNVEFGPSQSTTAGQYGPDQVWSQGSLNGNETIPNFVIRARLDQAWGHIALSGVVTEINTSCNINCNAAAAPSLIPSSAGTMPNISRTGWGLNLTGHFNTWGKDKLMGGAFYGEGLGTYMGDYGGQAGIAIGQTPSGNYISSLPTEWGVYAAYKHFWTDQLRTTVAGGYSHIQNESSTYCGGTSLAFCNGFGGHIIGVPNNLSAALVNGAVAVNTHWSIAANLIWSPVNNVDLGAQIIYYHVEAEQANFINDMNPNGHDLRVEAGATLRF